MIFSTGSFEEDTTLPKGLENWNEERKDGKKEEETKQEETKS